MRTQFGRCRKKVMNFSFFPVAFQVSFEILGGRGGTEEAPGLEKQFCLGYIYT